LIRQVQSNAQAELMAANQPPASEPPDSPSLDLPNPERDRASQTVAALEDFLAAIHAAGANHRA
jgi:hypothetical protein